MDVFDGPGGPQIHDWNPGIKANGLFWTNEIDRHDAGINPGNGRASLHLEDVAMPDYHDVVNALLRGPSVPGMVSVHAEWSMSGDKHSFDYAPETWTANVVFNELKAAWTGENPTHIFETGAIGDSSSIFAEVGHERNGVFYS